MLRIELEKGTNILWELKTMLTDDLKRKHVPVSKKWKRWYTDAEKLEAVKLYLITGNQAAVAAALNLNKNTINQWANAQWFKDLAEQIKREGQIRLSAKLKKIAEKALEVTMDRLENGEWVYDQKTGEMVRRPVLSRDAHKIATSFLDKAGVMDEKQTQQRVEDSTQDRLAQLAIAFAQMAAKTNRVEIIDNEPPKTGIIEVLSPNAPAIPQ